MSDLNKGLIAHYTFDDADTDNGKLRDKSAYGNDGTLQNSPDIGKNGIVGEAYKMSQSSRVFVPGTSTNDYSTYTISSWVRVSQFPPSQRSIQLNKEYMFRAYDFNSDGTYNFHVGNGSNNWVTTDNVGDVGFEGGKWQHLAVVYDGTDGVLYVNGEEKVRKSLPSAGGSNESEIYIGSYNDTSDFPFEGLVDDVRIYTRDLNKSEINRLYQQRSPNELRAQPGSGSAGIVAHWPLDDSGSTAEDKVGNNDGTLQGGVTTGVQSLIGRGMKFDGTKNTSVDTSGTGYGQKIADTNEFTISYWINYDELKNSAVPFGNVLGANELWTEPWRDSNAGVSARFIDDSGSQVLLETSYFVEANRWYLATFTWDGDDLKAYIDADEKGSVNSSGSVVNPPDYFFIGTGNENEGATIKGTISDARLYNRALSDSEIRSIYDQGLSVPESGLEGHFTMDSENYDESTQTLTSVTPTGVTAAYSSSTSPVTGGVIDDSFEFSNDLLETDGTIASKAPVSATFSAWVNINVGATEDQSVIIAFDGTAPGTVEVIVDADGAGNADPREIWWATTPDWTVNQTGAKVELGEWSLITLTHNENFGTRVYLNGELVDEKMSASPLSWSNASKIDFGKRTGGNQNWPLKGKIDDAKVYSRALSGSEVRMLHRSTAPYYKSEVDGVSARNVSVKGASNPFVLIRNLQFFADYENWSSGQALPNRWSRNSGVVELADKNGVGEETDNPIVGNKSGLYESSNNETHESSVAFPFQATKTFTFVVWVDNVNFEDNPRFLTKWGNSSQDYFLGTFKNNDTWRYFFRGNNGLDVDLQVGSADQQKHMLMCYHDKDNSEVGISVDGGNFSTGTYSGSPNDGSSPLAIGGNSNETELTDGIIDHVSFDTSLEWTNAKTWLYNNGNGRTWNEVKQYTG